MELIQEAYCADIQLLDPPALHEPRNQGVLRSVMSNKYFVKHLEGEVGPTTLGVEVEEGGVVVSVGSFVEQVVAKGGDEALEMGEGLLDVEVLLEASEGDGLG